MKPDPIGDALEAFLTNLLLSILACAALLVGLAVAALVIGGAFLWFWHFTSEPWAQHPLPPIILYPMMAGIVGVFIWAAFQPKP